MVFVFLVLVLAAALNTVPALQSIEPSWVVSTPAILINGEALMVRLNPATLILSLIAVSLLTYIAIILRAFVQALAAAAFATKSDAKTSEVHQHLNEVFRPKNPANT